MKKLLLALTVVVLMGAATGATAQQQFNFNGQALLPAMVGGDLTAYLPVINDGLVDTPLPLDFDNYEYTIVVTGLTMDVDNGDLGGKEFSGGTITLFEDDATPADYGTLSTFSDGTPLLVGTFVYLNRVMFSFNPTIGSAGGRVNWTGGTHLGDLAPADQFDWPFVVSVSTSTTVTEPGFDENWNGKVEPQEPVVRTLSSSVGRIKGRH